MKSMDPTQRVQGAGPLLLHGARLFCPGSGRDEAGGVLIEYGVIADIGPHLTPARAIAAETVDCRGNLLCPGLIDCQVFTGEPGAEHRETLATASQAAAAGGVTSMLCMPNTDPVIDDIALVHYMKQAARDKAIINVYPAAAMTKNLDGRELAEIGLLKEAGAAAFSNGKRSVSNAQVMRLVMAYAKDFDALLIHHVEDRDLSENGVMNEGEVSSRLGLQGIPAAAEVIMLDRDLRLVALTGGRYHAAALSCAAALDPIRHGKAQGLRITCGVSINNLTLNENDVTGYRTYFKMKPPLRREEDRQALVAGVADGAIDVIMSNHDPKDADMKRRPFAEASDGAIGLETMLAAALQLYHNKEVDLTALLAAMTSKPATLLGLPSGRLVVGAPADFALVNLDLPWRVEKAKLRSRSKNSPFDESVFQGKVIATYVGGRRVYHHAGV